MKNQIKKSLSLFLAVLMILSCWVWVAPQEAEAANTPEEGYYYVEVRAKLDDWDNDENVSRNNWKITTANGTYTLTSNSIYNGGETDTTGNYVHAYGWVYGFPTGITHEFGQKHNGKSGTDAGYYGDGWGVREASVWVGDSKTRLAQISSSDRGYKTTTDNGSYSGDQITTFFTDIAPKFSYFKNGTSPEINITLNAIGGEDAVAGVTWNRSDFYDQYGIKWSGAEGSYSTTGTPYISTTATGEEITGDDADDIYYDSAKGQVVAKPTLQIDATANNAGIKEYYLIQKFENNLAYTGAVATSVASAKIIVTYPPYTVNFNGSGAIAGHKYTMEMSAGSPMNSTHTETGIYGKPMSKWPTGAYSTDAEGKINDDYTFKGFWTTPQPTTGNASYNAKGSEFAEPISSDKFAEYETNGGVADGAFITYEDKTYYNAGKQWDPSNKTFTESVTYYGWWLSKDLTVKFYDIDGSFLGSYLVKVGQDQNAFTWPVPRESFVSGPFEYKNFNGTWENVNGEEISQNSHVFKTDLILTPKYSVSVDNKYLVTFKDTNGSNISSVDFDYRSDLNALGKIPPNRNVPNAIAQDKQYSYTFEGWATQKPAEGSYHIVLEDSDFDTAGTQITIKNANSDWIVRNDVTYYPVFRRHIRTYAVKFTYKDSSGIETSRETTVVYGKEVKAPIEYVPYTYATLGFEYGFDKWQYRDANNKTGQFDYDKTIVLNEDNFNMALSAVADGDNVSPILITAKYGTPQAKPYNVTFSFKDEDGNDVSKVYEVTHGDPIGQENIDGVIPGTGYDNGEAMVYYNGQWKVKDGTAEKEFYHISELSTFGPTSHITFEAVYGNPEYFYTITYIDGTNTFSERILANGDNTIPAWTVEETNDNGTPDDTSDDTVNDVPYVPTIAETTQGYYVFQGWFDEKQTDTTYTKTNGTKYDAVNESIEVTGDLTLYPQFTFEPFTYTITFLDYTGKTQLRAGQYQYGQNIETLVIEAVRAAQGRAQDEKFKYEFIGWDKEVPTFCEGSDMTFIAQYKGSYRYYQANWYNSVLVDGKWVADKSTDADGVETALLATTKHTYDSKVNNPSVSVTAPIAPADTNKTYVFAGWKYMDKDGVEHDYIRGMKITDNMVFYATYTETAKAYKVTTVVPGEKDVTYDVAAGQPAKRIPTPVSGYVDATSHKQFGGWYTTANFQDGTAFDVDETPINGDITIYAKVETAIHDYTDANKEVVAKPTYYAAGQLKKWCECGATITEDIAMLTDTVKPTGTIYLGTQGSWSSNDAPASATDNDEVIYFANEDTDIILTINDTGDVGDYNPAGIGKGIKMIRGFISEGVYSQGNQDVNISEVLTVFEDNSQAQNNSANYVVKLGEYGGLENGKTYVAYYYAIDKAGNVLNENVRTAKFIYDTSDPTFTVEGKNNSGKPGVVTVTYCDVATIKGIEPGATLTINGTVIEADKIVDGEYTITTAGYQMITVVDQAGNKASRKIYVADDHNYVVKEILSTCTQDGYKESTCTVCGDTTEREIYKTAGHTWRSYPVSATCDEAGYTLKTCELCGIEEKIYTYTDADGVVQEIAPALGHIYDKDENGDVIYTVVTEATCKAEGKEVAICKVCGERLERSIEVPTDINKQNHNWGSVRTLKPTCTENGKEYKICGLCGYQVDINVLPATGHKETKWIETVPATCGTAGVEALVCKKCNAPISETRAIAATGRHILAVSEDPTKTFDPTADAEGQITRYCTQCGQEWVEKVNKIEKYTVTFVDEDGTIVLATIADVIAGTTIIKTDVTEPTKANSADGKYKYTFAGWKDAESGKAITLPFDVTGNVTLKATYTQSNVIYTHQFVVPNTWVSTAADDTVTYTVFATMMGAKGDIRKPVATPTFSLLDKEADAELKKLYTFEFLGWSTDGSKENITEDFTVNEDTSFIAVFKANPISYQVIFYNGIDYVWDTTVAGGATVTFGGTTPTKAYDDDKHYTFDKWYADATLKNEFNFDTPITATTRLYAGFAGADHVFAPDADKENIPATCTTPEYKFEKCACGETRRVEGIAALGHTPGTPETFVDEEGVSYLVTKCTVCGETISKSQTSVTITFKNYNNVRVDTLNLNVGEQIVFDTIPTRPDDGINSYTFAGWYVEGDETQTVVTLGTATTEVTYIAKYTATPLTFRVTYVDVNNKTLQTQEGIAYGSAIPAFTGATPTKDFDDTYHYAFAGWDIEDGATVTKNLIISPVFDEEKHDYKKQADSADATCTTPGGGDLYKCKECDHSYTEKATIPALGHKEIVDHKDAYDYVNGKAYVYKTCERECGATFEPELIKSVELTKALAINGAPIIDGTIVELYKDGVSVAVKATTNGEVTFYIYEKGTYEIKYAGQTLADATVNNKLEINSTVDTPVEPSEPEEEKCSCTCHEGTFWGVLFRLFHKLIKLFTGKIGCCSCPDPKY